MDRTVISNKKFIEEAQTILSKYPNLNIFRQDGNIFLVGNIDLVDEFGVLQDTYLIEIHPTQDFPFSFPLLYVKGNRIPINIDWHIYDDGHCCIKTIPEEQLTCVNGITLTYFIESEVLPYLFNQTHRRLKGYFLNERTHGIIGELEFFMDFFNTKEISKIVQYLIFIFKNNEPNRVANCFCGNKKKFRKCHKQVFQKLKKLGQEDLLLTIRRIIFSPIYYENDPINALKLRNYFK